jgi:hypothetical protein
MGVVIRGLKNGISMQTREGIFLKNMRLPAIKKMKNDYACWGALGGFNRANAIPSPIIASTRT